MMLDILDYRKLATDLVGKVLDKALASAEKVLSTQWATLKNRNPELFIDYLCRKASQINSVRNIVYYTQSVPLYDVFVPTRLAEGTLSTDDVIRDLAQPATPRSNPADPKAKRQTKALIVAGSAGTGKSLFMRHAFFAIQQEGDKRIPIFLELRSFNRMDLTDFEEKIQQDLIDNGTKISREQVILAAEAGLLTLLLDGLDELRAPVLAHYGVRLLAFVNQYPLCPVVVSTRLFDTVYSWTAFEIRRLSKLSLNESITLISKLDFDPDKKSKFELALKNRLYRDYFEFASNPLLCTVMFLTYSYHGRISRSHHEFLEDAYQTLWSRHDDRKSGFERHRFSQLSKRDFGRLLAGLAFSSYFKGDYEMTEREYLKHFESASDLTGISCDAQDFRRDLTLSTCLALEDGPVLEFCHRSLHEYFAACFVSELPDSSVESIVDEISDRVETDSVLPLVRSIAEEKIEKLWLLPKIPFLLGKINTGARSINRYGELLERDTEVARLLEMIRILYRFETRGQQLVAAYHAGRDMGNPAIATDSLSADRKKIVELFRSIDTRYSKKVSALDKLRHK